MKEIFERFESFLKRAFLPSMVFYFFVIILGVICNKNNFYSDLQKIDLKDKDYLIFVFLVFSIGLSYFLNMLHQLIFDNNIKENYDTMCLWKKENDVLKNLRDKVKEKQEYKEFNKEELNDYLLYQILSKKHNVSKRYVDDTKTYGIIFLSVLLASIFITFLYKSYTIAWLIIVFFVLYFMFFETIKAKYRSRAIRLYVNYLMDEKKDEKKDETNKNCIIECKDIKNMIDKFIKAEK